MSMLYIYGVMTQMLIYALLAASLNIAIGYTGLLNLGHVAFFGIGAYTSALLVQSGVPFVFALILAGAFASIGGYVLIIATNRLKGDYLALATLGFSFVVFSLLLNLRSVTGGALGVAGIAPPSLFGISIIGRPAYLLFALIVVGLCVWFLLSVVKSPFGRLLQAVRDDELGLRVLGKNTFALKTKAMMISAFFAGIAGSLFAHFITFIDPNSFMITQLIVVLTIVIVGGLASIWGSIIGAGVVLLIPELLRFLTLPLALEGTLQQIIYGIVLIFLLLYRPRGILGKVDLK